MNREERAREILTFLLGEGPLDGHWLGEKVEGRGAYWWRDHVRAAFAEQEVPRVPEGWVLVPREPTEEMLTTVWNAELVFDTAKASAIWSAMLAAAPTAPQPGEDAVIVETYRQMHEIATIELGYESILEALEATPPVAIVADPQEGVNDTESEAHEWVRKAYREPEDLSQLDAFRFTRWNMAVAYQARKDAATTAPQQAPSPDAEIAALREALSKVLPIGDSEAPGDKVIAFYIRMDELRSLRALAAGRK
ncbi:hypothetical protein LZK98_11650 [Sphingomonas cannabina]|uniref:hypothetical protein n=1 Tax=Sphingomonas cannabina TaxID=2899123 RepID=UPI001F324E60|nr:hypothetical protein [Sphingomonas cannabina]UIJ43745.1 hypothetical protein LZK98_11650 [Sphingomonas cannabina]